MLIASAILLNNIIYSGHRHCDIIHQLAESQFPLPICGEQGFIDDKGVFYDRLEAAQYALATHQIKELHWPPFLYSEDLY
jgi:hypothetical protein